MDITKCKGTNCNKREFCYRFTAMESKHYQSWFVTPPINLKGECDEYWEMRCPYCHQYAGIHKLGCASGKVTVKL